MLEPKQIEVWITEGMPCQFAHVEGDGQHFEAVIVSNEFAGLSRVKRQQRVFDTVREHLATGVLHALSMKTMTPEEWEANHG